MEGRTKRRGHQGKEGREGRNRGREASTQKAHRRRGEGQGDSILRVQGSRLPEGKESGSLGVKGNGFPAAWSEKMRSLRPENVITLLRVKGDLVYPIWAPLLLRRRRKSCLFFTLAGSR